VSQSRLGRGSEEKKFPAPAGNSVTDVDHSEPINRNKAIHSSRSL